MDEKPPNSLLRTYKPADINERRRANTNMKKNKNIPAMCKIAFCL